MDQTSGLENRIDSSWLANTDAPWAAMGQVVNFFSPILILTLFIAIALAVVTLWATQELSRRALLHNVLNLFAFGVIGAIVGIMIRLSGGFGMGGGTEVWAKVPALLSAFAAIAGLFYGENRVAGEQAIKPLGTASAILMMMIAYLHTALILGASSG